MKPVLKPLLNAVALVVAASAMTVSAPALSASLVPEALVGATAVGTAASGAASQDQGAANALNRLSEMKIRHAVLAESLQNIQIEAQIKSVEKKMNGDQGVSSATVPDVSLLTCSSGAGRSVSGLSVSAASHCTATLLLPNGTRIAAYPGTVIGDGLKIVGITEQGVLAANGSSRFYLPFSGGVTNSSQGAVVPTAGDAAKAGLGSQGLASALPPPVFGGTPNTATPPAGMQSPSSFPGGMQ